MSISDPKPVPRDVALAGLNRIIDEIEAKKARLPVAPAPAAKSAEPDEAARRTALRALGGVGTKLEARAAIRHQIAELTRQLTSDPIEQQFGALDLSKLYEARRSLAWMDRVVLHRGVYRDAEAQLVFEGLSIEGGLLNRENLDQLRAGLEAGWRAAAIQGAIPELEKLGHTDLAETLLALAKEQAAEATRLAPAREKTAGVVDGVLANRVGVEKLFPGLGFRGKLAELMRKVADDVGALGAGNRWVGLEPNEPPRMLSRLGKGWIDQGPLYRAAARLEAGDHPWADLRYGFSAISVGLKGPFIQALKTLAEMERDLLGREHPVMI